MSIAAKIIDKGIKDIDVSMFSEVEKKKILTEVAELLYRQGKLRESAVVISQSTNKEKQIEFAKNFLKENNPALAVYSLINSGAVDLIKEAGTACIELGDKEAALKAFLAIDDMVMVRFIRENL